MQGVPRRVIERRGEVIALDSAGDDDRPVIGSKATSLAIMVRIGLPVPPGFCLSGTAYRKHIDDMPIKIDRFLEKLTSAPFEVRRSLLEELRQEIVEAPLSDKLREEIEGCYRALRADRVAVRSSATAEDLPGHSFAGQHGTYFVSGLPDCLRAVKDCWASLWTERAVDYRARNGFDHLDAEMAVIVQELVSSDVSGVLFTADPVTGRSDQLIIEACFGLGEALVSGKVSPDRMVLKKDDLRVLEQKVSRKAVEVVLDESGCVQERTVPSELESRSCLDEATARRLGELALEAESAFGSPQDMEWAISGGDIFFVQSRPITTLPKERTWEDRQVWSNVNAGEVLPDAATPATWSLIEMLIQPIFGSVFERAGIDLGDNPAIGQLAGRAYFNLNTVVGAIRHFPGWKGMDLNGVLGGAQGKSVKGARIEIAEEDIPDVKFSPLKLIVRMPGLVRWFLAHTPGKGQAFIATIRRKSEEFRKVDIASLSDDSLAERLDTCLTGFHDVGETLVFSMMGMFSFTRLDGACRKWLGDVEGSYANRLLSGMGEMDSAEAGLAMWRLAEAARGKPEVEKLLLPGESYEGLRPRIARAAGGGDFIAEFDEFMAEHGHHTRGEIELFNARWSETPDYVLDVVRGYLGGMDGRSTNPVVDRERRAEESAALAEECRRRLRNPIKRKLFDFYLDQARRGSVVRENGKSEAIRLIAFVRSILLEMGKRLAGRGVLEDVNDIFFLRLDEVDPVFRGKSFDVGGTVAERRAEYLRNLEITPPAVIVGRFDPDNFIPDSVDGSAEVFEGLAVSPGVVTGPARVILRSDAEERVLPGEILVAPFTDPGWSPYFITAAAIVMDMGGLLSHGSIVAREYGIPAVVNVGPATKIIKTGQMLQVDGMRGIVRILAPS
ncbi:MAG: PEP-utilizing enzyme [Actinobacteria bacterium]|nr:PEP-utilizing enzyme [Actinomycetota bacterium]